MSAGAVPELLGPRETRLRWQLSPLRSLWTRWTSSHTPRRAAPRPPLAPHLSFLGAAIVECLGFDRREKTLLRGPAECYRLVPDQIIQHGCSVRSGLLAGRSIALPLRCGAVRRDEPLFTAVKSEALRRMPRALPSPPLPAEDEVFGGAVTWLRHVTGIITLLVVVMSLSCVLLGGAIACRFSFSQL